MRYAVISDIHSNLEALTASLGAIDSLKADSIVCLGDLVGYNANPNECLDIIRRKNIQCVMGNHDSRVAGLEGPEDFNYQAAEAVYWTREKIREDNREFLKSLPRALLVDKRFLAVHGWVNDTDQYILSATDAYRNFALLKEQHKSLSLCFFGHTHVPIAYIQEDESIRLSSESPLKMEKGLRYLINPGGLGQPRDRDPRASFLIYDTKKSLVTFHRVEYDINSTAEKILSAGLPERLAERLKLGW